MKRLLFFAVISIVFSAVSVAGLVNDVAPDWRGDAFSTRQAWTFDNDNHAPADLTINENPFGTPTAEIIGVDDPYGPPLFEAPDTYWKESDPLNPHGPGHDGVWRIYGDSNIKFYIPNNPVENESKTIWFQMTYYASGSQGAEPEFMVYPDTDFEVTLVSKTQTDDDYYYHAIWEIVMQPNPIEEWISIQPRDCTIYVDEVSIDTICVPEPATIGLLAIGGLLMFRRRK